MFDFVFDTYLWVMKSDVAKKGPFKMLTFINMFVSVFDNVL